MSTETKEFEIQADDYFKAFDLAYESYGPQVNNLYYVEKESLTAL